MRIFGASSSTLSLVTILLSIVATATPFPVLEEVADDQNATEIDKRDCSGTLCGWNNQLCCSAGQYCYTDSIGQAQCGTGVASAVTTGWMFYTSTWIETGVQTHTSIWSTYIGGGIVQATPTPSAAGCTGGQTPCYGPGGTVCCAMGYWCQTNGQCALIAAGSGSGGVMPTGTIAPIPPNRPTASSLILVTVTGSPTTTMPFITPIATGANATMIPSTGGGGGISGGAIAGIVIGVIAGIILLILLCLFCCAKSLFDGIMALLGVGRKRKHTHEETIIEEHHHGSHAAGGAGGRWYGSRPPSGPKKKSSGFGGLLGVGALLGGMALALGLKRKHDRKYDDKSTVTGTSASYSYYTSTSSASSDDRRTRGTRQSRPSRHSSRR